MATINTNSTWAWTQAKYAKKVSALIFTKSVAMSLANTELQDQLPDGTTIYRPTTSFLSINQYTANNTQSYDNLELGNETLVINDTPMVAFTLDQLDEDDAGWNIRSNTIENVAKLLREYIDGKFFAQVLNFDNSYNSGTATALTKANAYDTVSDAISNALTVGADESMLNIIMDSKGISKIGQNAVNSTFALGDKTYTGWYTSRSIDMAELYRSEHLTAVWSFIIATTPSNGDTVKINGATFTFVTTIGSTAGNVLIGASATTAGANLQAAINKEAGAGTTYVDFTGKVRNKFLRGLTAASTTGTVTLTSIRGYRGDSMFDRTGMTAAGNKFGQFVIYYAIMQTGSIHMVLRDNVKAVNGRIPASITYEYLTWSRFGLKVFEDGREVWVVLPVEARAAD